MSLRDRMYTQFSLYALQSPIAQVVEEIKAGKTLAFVAIQDRDEFTITTQIVLKKQLESLAGEFGAEALQMTLADVDDLWKPQAALSVDYEGAAFSESVGGEARPVVENGKLVGIWTTTRREAFGGLASMYGPRFALFEEARASRQTPAPQRICPNCHRTIDFYRPKRVGNQIERHCPECNALIQANQNG